MKGEILGLGIAAVGNLLVLESNSIGIREF